MTVEMVELVARSRRQMAISEIDGKRAIELPGGLKILAPLMGTFCRDCGVAIATCECGRKEKNERQ